MKYLVLVPDGAADLPVLQLNGKTPLEVANKPNMDLLAKKGRCGLMHTIPDGLPAGSEVANLSILGYDPKKCYQGRGVLEAASLGISIDKDDVVFRCNTICVENGLIKSHSAGHISTAESRQLIETLNNELSSDTVKFYPGLDYRHILLLKNMSSDVVCFPPHDNIGKPINNLLPCAQSPDGRETAELLISLIKQAEEILKSHPVNLKRIRDGKQPANFIWPWAGGKRPDMEKFSKRFGISGAVITAVDLIKGIGIYAGFDVIKVEGATGLYNTNYEGKAEAGVMALGQYDFVYVHVEATDEAAHEGNVELKIKCIEDFDRRLLGNIIKKIDWNNTAIALIPDHFTPVSVRGHTNQPVPFVIYHPEFVPDSVEKFSESACASGGLGIICKDIFIRTLLGK
ncbi:MAG: cofactor-independent phosphoglycerate mutase [Candidatus Omnitrophica bacterium]|nr:cofactor-independent phosphoglycerate mutase [Candidatus Omnitrophota bacterium]